MKAETAVRNAAEQIVDDLLELLAGGGWEQMISPRGVDGWEAYEHLLDLAYVAEIGDQSTENSRTREAAEGVIGRWQDAIKPAAGNGQFHELDMVLGWIRNTHAEAGFALGVAYGRRLGRGR